MSRGVNETGTGLQGFFSPRTGRGAQGADSTAGCINVCSRKKSQGARCAIEVVVDKAKGGGMEEEDPQPLERSNGTGRARAQAVRF